MIPRLVQDLCQRHLICFQSKSSFKWFRTICLLSRDEGLQTQIFRTVGWKCSVNRKDRHEMTCGQSRDVMSIILKNKHNRGHSVTWKRSPLIHLHSSCLFEHRYLLHFHRFQHTHTWTHSGLMNSRKYATKAQTTFTLKTKLYKDFLQSLEDEYTSLLEMRDSGIQRYGHSENIRVQTLQPIVEVFQRVKEKYDDLTELESMRKDDEVKEMVEAELKDVLSAIQELEDQLVSVLTPPDKSDDCDIILEVECGAGGLESMLFAEEIFNMYASLSQRLGWQFEVIEQNRGEKGYMSVSASISGNDVYQLMKFEGGVHRVQRVPATERGGRTHTSTVAVAILPQPKEIDIELNKKDLKVESMKSSGPGGQNVNKVNTAVRIVHIPTGMVVECQETRSNAENQRLAMKKLKSRLYEQQLKDQTNTTVSKRKIQVGNKDRNEKIRTYNFVQDRITDHRVGYSVSHLTSFMGGGPGLTDVMEKLQEGARYETINYRLEEFEKNCEQSKGKVGSKK